MKQERDIKKKAAVALLAIVLGALGAQDVFAMAAPAAGTFGYSIYTLGITNILKGPIGFVVGALALAYGAYLVIQAKIFPAIGALLGGGILITADALLVSMGLLI